MSEILRSVRSHFVSNAIMLLSRVVLYKNNCLFFGAQREIKYEFDVYWNILLLIGNEMLTLFYSKLNSFNRR